MDRRYLLTGLFGLASAPVLAQPRGRRPAILSNPVLAEIEFKAGGRLGVFATDTATRRIWTWRGDERFTMCSTFKSLLAAQVLARVDAGEENLSRTIHYGPGEVIFGSPVTAKHVDQGGLSIGTLTRAIVEASDNTAAILLMRAMGGPESLTRWLRSIGDDATRMDRYEPDANLHDPLLDTTTPRAIIITLRRILLGNLLSAKSRQMLEGWMIASTTGAGRLRAALPKDWIAGSKTGTSAARQTNDTAIIRPPGKRPLLLAVYYDAPYRNYDEREAVLREVGRAFVTWAASPVNL